MHAPIEQDAQRTTTDDQNIVTIAVDWLTSISARVHIAAELALAEARLAVVSIAVMIFLATLAALLVLSAWGLLLAGAVHSLLQAGLPLWAILTGVAVGHLLAAVFLAHRALRMSENMNFRATRAQFASTSSVQS
jgi:predicted permease